ncbi:AAA family ATPase [Marinobacter orientalis]|uniref:AAA family ATPase n=1 Tax=Marinobacter orientalis TaxID=1928859 RepID=A0A7Y0WTB4_9GAMM|nr:AAA family ATPase [Marinobacter orientalis]NMT64793.1 AAA family ATPase [Marinobacter orientalis]TGX48784.1 hypothetical protein DIT72_12200 [Marinobacter orientalis]
MSSDYGFQQLVLLNSAGYERAELPLDESVSLIAPNNTGKTSLINALQYLLIIDKRHLDFGAHDKDKARRFYFPSNSSYILLEVTLPESGSVVLGCVGKGVSHDYNYFAYQGPLHIEEYRLDNGKLVTQPQLLEQLAHHGRTASFYSSADFAEMVYGGARRRGQTSSEFTVFRLENRKDANAYRQVLTRTLRLDKLSSGEVKRHLLQIFSRQLPDSVVDFKQEWDKAFAEVNQDREQYRAAHNQQTLIDELERQQDERLATRGRIIARRPLIDDGLQRWQNHYQTQSESLEHQHQNLQKQEADLLQRDRDQTRRQSELNQQLAALKKNEQRCDELENRFTLIHDRSQLEQQLASATEERDRQIALLTNAHGQSAVATDHQLRREEQELSALRKEQETLSDNLYLTLKQHLSEEQLSVLNRGLNRQLLTLSPGDYQLESQQLLQWLQDMPEDWFELPGLNLSVANQAPQYEQRSAEEIAQLIEDCQGRLRQLQEQKAASREMESQKKRKAELEQEVKSLEKDLEQFDELTQLQKSRPDRLKEMEVARQELAEIDQAQTQASAQQQTLRDQIQELINKRQALDTAHQEIDRIRQNRGDSDDQFNWLSDLPHTPWVGDTELPLDQLAQTLRDYQRDCYQLKDLDRDLHHRRITLHSSGLTKFQYAPNPEEEIRLMVEFRHHLAREAEALEKKARSAVVTVTASLRDLRGNLQSFENAMHEFNRLISRRKLSDLKVFRIQPVHESHLVEAIDLLIQTSEKVESGESFELFNQTSVLDDRQLDQARQLLIDEGSARHGLKVADLFRLTFELGKENQAIESFDDIDSAASNGTVLMAKLVTGLAMLHLMQDKTRNVQALCYLDEALALDAANQRSLIKTASEFGFALMFASPSPLITAHYCVPIQQMSNGMNHISRKHWQILQPLEAVKA